MQNQSSESDSQEPHFTRHQKRLFSYNQKDECWNNSPKMIGRDPERWRLDVMGNPVCRALRGCLGPLCHEYDHIVPFSKGGKTDVTNCQVLQTTLNRVKSNRIEISYNELKTISPNANFSDQEYDAIERAIYGNINKKEDKNI